MAAKPVLARLPDVSAEVELQRTTKKLAAGGVDYRFDPPQAADRQAPGAEAERYPQSPTLKSELIFSPHASRTHQPHVFERSRPAERRMRTPRHASPVLPASNPFAIPRTRLIDTLSPLIRFVTLFALFTAAGTWAQVTGLFGTPARRPAEAPTTTAQEPVNPAAKTADRAGSPPSSAGPARTTPESNTRVGRVRDNDDYAKLRGDIVPDTISASELGVGSPILFGAAGNALPRVQTTELPQDGGEGDTDRNHCTTNSPAVAQAPGTSIDTPSPR